MPSDTVRMATYTSIVGLADKFGLPLAWLRREARAERIPSLRVGRRLLFDPEAVAAALADMSRPARGGDDE
jgi:hypothetical protein